MRFYSRATRGLQRATVARAELKIPSIAVPLIYKDHEDGLFLVSGLPAKMLPVLPVAFVSVWLQKKTGDGPRRSHSLDFA